MNDQASVLQFSALASRADSFQYWGRTAAAEHCSKPRLDTSFSPCTSKITNPISVVSRENEVIGLLPRDALAQQLVNSIGHCDFTAISVLSGSGVKPECSGEKVNLF